MESAWKTHHLDSKFFFRIINWSDIFFTYLHLKTKKHCRGKVVMPLRITKPWLLFDWIYKLTETASAELDQKRKLDEFTRKVSENKNLLAKSISIANSNNCIKMKQKKHFPHSHR